MSYHESNLFLIDNQHKLEVAYQSEEAIVDTVYDDILVGNLQDKEGQ